MAVVGGQVTFSSTGTKMVAIGSNVSDLDFTGGARPGTTETSGLISKGHADSGGQWCHVSKDGKSETLTAKCIVLYDSAGTKKVEAAVTGGLGTSTITFNCTLADANYPFYIIART